MGLALTYVDRRCRAGDIRPSTAGTQRKVLVRFAESYGRRPAERLGPADIERWRAGLEQLAPGTKRAHFSTVRNFCRWLVEHNHVRRDPMVGMKAPRVPRSIPRCLSAEEIGRLYDACEDTRDSLILTLGLQLGLRRAEIASLDAGDVDLVADVLAVHGKGGHVDLMPLTTDARAAIVAYIEQRGVLGGPLLRGDRRPHAGVTPQWVSWRWTAMAYRSGVKRGAWDGVASHASRRTAATDTYRRTRDPMLVKDLMRWATLQTATAYIHATDIERLRRGAEGRHYAPAPRRPGVESA